METIGIIISNICGRAGTERAVVNMANAMTELTENKVIIISVYSKNDDQMFYEINAAVRLIHLAYRTKTNAYHRIGTYYSLFRDLKEICEKETISVLMGTIHAYNSIISCLRKPVTIGCEHMNYAACPKIPAMIRRLAYKHLDQIVLLTTEDREHYSFIDKGRLSVIPNIRSFFPEKPATLADKRIITIGRLCEQKGYDILLSFAKTLQQKIPGWTIDIFGDGEMKETLENTIREQHLEEFVRIQAPTSNIQQELLHSGMYLMTSRHEGLPMVLLEAQACGLPVVSFDCPEGPRDVIRDGIDGYLILPFNTDLMIDKIVLIATSEQERIKLGRNARIRSGDFSAEQIVSEWCQTIEKAKANRREKKH